MALGIALRYVLEALRKPPGTKMYMFGTTALDRFKIRLKDYPHYCQHLASIPHYKEFPAHLVEYIGFGQRNQEPPNPVINRTSMVSFVVCCCFFFRPYPSALVDFEQLHPTGEVAKALQS